MNVGHSSDSTESELSILFSLQNYDFNTVSQPVLKFEKWKNRFDKPLLSLTLFR